MDNSVDFGSRNSAQTAHLNSLFHTSTDLIKSVRMSQNTDRLVPKPLFALTDTSHQNYVIQGKTIYFLFPAYFRPPMKLGKVMFSQMSVSHSVQGGVGIPGPMSPLGRWGRVSLVSGMPGPRSLLSC